MRAPLRRGADELESAEVNDAPLPDATEREMPPLV